MPLESIFLTCLLQKHVTACFLVLVLSQTEKSKFQEGFHALKIGKKAHSYQLCAYIFWEHVISYSCAWFCVVFINITSDLLRTTRLRLRDHFRKLKTLMADYDSRVSTLSSFRSLPLYHILFSYSDLLYRSGYRPLYLPIPPKTRAVSYDLRNTLSNIYYVIPLLD